MNTYQTTKQKLTKQPNENLPSNISLRPDVLISGKLFTKDNWSLEDSWLIMFATSDRDWNEYTRVESLVALQWLKCNRNSYHISNMSEIMKKVKCEDISKNASIRMIEKQSFAASNMERNLKPKEQDFIVSLINLWYGQEDRLPIREAFTKLDNSVREKKIRSLYTKAKSDITNIEKVKELIAYCKESMRVQSENLSKWSDIETIKAMFYSVWI